MKARIEPWGPGNLELLEQLMRDPAMTEHLGGPESPEKIAERQARYESTEGMFKIVDVETGEGVGSVGFWDREWRDATVHEVGWSVVPAFQGRGLASAATALVLGKARAAQTHPLRARVPVDGQPTVERDLPQARLHAARSVPVRVPAGVRKLDVLQRLAS